MKYDELNKINSKNVTCCRNTVKSMEKGQTKSKKNEIFYWPKCNNMLFYKCTYE